METTTQNICLYYTPDEFALLIGTDKRTLSRMSASGEAPKPIKFTSKMLRYSKRGVHEWLDGMEQAA